MKELLLMQYNRYIDYGENEWRKETTECLKGLETSVKTCHIVLWLQTLVGILLRLLVTLKAHWIGFMSMLAPGCMD